MSYKDILPKSMEELKALSFDDRVFLWSKYSPHPYKRQIRSLWYYIQCDRLKLRIEPKFLAKIKKYKDNPLECDSRVYQHKYCIPPGTVITRTFRGIEHRIMVNDNETFYYNGKTYRTLSGIAREIAGIKISGPDFFGLTKKNHNDN